MQFVPEEYTAQETGGLVFWHHPDEPKTFQELFFGLLPKILNETTSLLGYTLQRKLNFCVYHSLEVARKSLDRPIPANMLMVPVSTPEGSLVIFLSPSIHPSHGDPLHMTRMLSHEIVHVMNLEVTESTKVLGDYNVRKYIPEWLDEGLAECISARVSGCLEVIEKAQEKAMELPRHWDYEIVNAILADLNSELRSSAFAWAITRVEALVRDHGVNGVFNRDPLYMFRD